MTRITKELARQIAKNLTDKKLAQIEKLRAELSATIKERMMKKIPSKVLELFKSNPEWLTKESSVQFCGNGFNYDYFSFSGAIPMINQRITPDDDFAKIVSEKKNEIDKKHKEYNALVNDTQIALFNFRTYANVKKCFPEAEKYLPAENITALVINIKDIQKRLSK